MMNARINSFKIFREVSLEIYKKIDKRFPEKSFDYIISFTVNCSLACELGLKAILAQSYKEVKNHKLNDLYFMLDVEEQLFIKANMPSLIDKTSSSIEFKNYINLVSNNFVEWRYFYEKNISTNWFFLYELMNSINLYFDGNNFFDYLMSLSI